MNTLGVALAAVFVSTLRSLLPWVTSRRWDSSSTSLRSFFRHVVHMSAYEYFGRRFGSGVRIYSSFAFAMGHFSKMGFVFYLLALTLSPCRSHERLCILWASLWQRCSYLLFVRFCHGSLLEDGIRLLPPCAHS